MAKSLLSLTLLVALTITGTVALILPKRSIPDNALDNYEYYDYPGKYNDFPIVVSKKAALLLDRLMVALQKAVEDQGTSGGDGIDTSVGSSRRQNPHSSPINSGGTSINNDKTSIDRRAQGKGRVYWRCYFNAVTCFKK